VSKKRSPRANVIICMPTMSHVPIETLESLMNVWQSAHDAKLTSSRPLIHPCSFVDDARNRLLERVLNLDDPPATHIFWMDSDMVIPANTIPYFVERNLDVIAGLYFQRGAPHSAVAYYETEEGPYVIDRIAPIEIDRLYNVDAVGFGCVMINLNAYRTLMEKYEGPVHVGTGRAPRLPVQRQSEDFYVCRRMREQGYNIYLDSSVMCGHVRSQVITFTEHKALRDRPLVPEEKAREILATHPELPFS
jgi:hypothetical protein